MIEYLCPECMRVLERDPNDPLFTGESYCALTHKNVTLERLTSGAQQD